MDKGTFTQFYVTGQQLSDSYAPASQYINLTDLQFTCKCKIKLLQMEGDLANTYVPFHNLITYDYSLGEFNSSEIKVDIDHPCDMVIQEIFDGSVNVIFSDDYNKPRLINSRFSVAEDSTFIIPDHFGDKDTSLYQEEELDSDTSLIKTINILPKLSFEGLRNGGSMKCGSYYFAFMLADNDDNETDVIAESGLVQCHIGDLNSPWTMRMGMENENTQKGVAFKLTNLDGAYDYVKVMYSRRTSGKTGQDVPTFHKLVDKYEIKNGTCEFIIWGHEPVKNISFYEFNPKYDYPQQVKSITECENRLFFGNVYKQKIPYEELQEFSYHLHPFIDYNADIGNYTDTYDMQSSLSDDRKHGYYNMRNVYNYVGYWPDEYYKFGVVYIFKDYTLSPVFNTLGVDFSLYDGDQETSKITGYDEIDTSRPEGLWNIDEDGYFIGNGFTSRTFNNFGVCRMPKVNLLLNPSKPIGIGFKLYENNNKDLLRQLDTQLIKKIKKQVLGCFFVRQKRKPLILAQGITIGKTKHGYGDVPVIKDDGGYFTESFLSPLFNIKSSEFEFNALGNSKVNIKSDNIDTEGTATIIPDSNLHESTFNQLFTSTEYQLQMYAKCPITYNIDDKYYPSEYKDDDATRYKSCKLTMVNTNRPLVTDGTLYFSSKAGDEYDVKKFTSVQYDWTKVGDAGANKEDCGASMFGTTKNTSHLSVPLTTDRVIRSTYGTYVGIQPLGDKLSYGQIFNVRPKDFIDNHTEEAGRQYHYKEQQIRKNDKSQYSAISDRMLWEEFEYDRPTYYRGDCYICPYTHRMQKGLTDPEFPTNSKILEPTSWANNFMVQTKFKGNDSTYINEVLDLYKIKIGKNKDLWKYILGTILGFPIVSAEKDTGDVDGSADKILDEDNVNKEITIYDPNVEKAAQVFGNCGVCLPDNPKYGKKGSAAEMFGAINMWKERGTKNINRSDVNAVGIGHWFTFTVMSNDNLCLRDIDIYHPEEQVQFNHSRSFYPLEQTSKDSLYKLPESQMINGACNTTTSERVYFTMPDVPYIKQQYDTRICYSELYAANAFRNGYRIIGEGSHQDYPKQCGTLVCIKEYHKQLIGIMEHGVMVVPISERIVAGSGEAGPVYMQANNVLSPTPLFIETTFGTTWKESVISTQFGIYGVDTIGKKIWKTDGQQVTVLSDMVLGRFLNEHMDFCDWDKAVKLGFKRVKTHYNAFKNDVIFTFQNDETEWVLCFNELLNKFVTFYSWKCTFMDNINNIPLSFDDEVTTSLIHTESFQRKFLEGHIPNTLRDFNKNIPEKAPELTLSNISVLTVIGIISWPDYLINDPTLKKAKCLDYLDIVYDEGWSHLVYKGLKLDAHNQPEYDSERNLQEVYEGAISDTIEKLNALGYLDVYFTHSQSDQELYIRLVAKSGKTHYLWKHGEAGVFREIDGKRSIKPTKWYGRQEPFEFEFICSGDTPDLQKIFNNISMLSNKAEPASFEYTIDGDGYDWYKYKPLLVWIEDYLLDHPTVKKKDLYTILLKNTLKDLRQREPFNTIPILPNVDEAKCIYKLPYLKHVRKSDLSSYAATNDAQYEDNATSTWLNHDPLLNQYKIKAEQKGRDIKKYGRLQGNIQYLEDNWKVEIRPVTFRYIYVNDKGVARFTKDSTQRLRDKYIKIKIKYTGEDLAIIEGVRTLYTESYA